MPFLPMWIDGLTPEMKKKAEQELGETEETRTQALKDLRRLIHGEEDFRPKMDDAFLLRFLRARKFDTEKTFKTLRNYYTFKVRYSHILTDYKPSELMKIYELNIMDVMQKRLEDGVAIGILRLGYFDIDSFTPEELLAACLLGTEAALQHEATQVCGVCAILDLENFSLRMLKRFANPRFLLRVVRIIQDCLPVRVQGFYIINEPFYFSLIFNILKQLISEKIKNRIHFFGKNLKSLHKKIPAELLPEEIGGSLGPFDNSNLRMRLLNQEANFEKMSKYGYQEKKAQFIRKRSSRSLLN